MTTARVPQGIPTGGQFATQARGESDVDLFGEQTARPVTSVTPSGMDFTGVDHSYASLRDVHMEEANAEGVTFQSADLRGAHMNGINADRADFTKATLTGADLSGGSFREAQFRDAALSGRMENTDMSSANFEKAEIGGADDVDFSDSCMAGATLRGHFERCNFSGVDFRGASMDHQRSPSDKVTFLDCTFDDEPWDGGAEWPSDFDPRVNAQFRAQGFDADDQARWQDACIDDAEVAHAYREHGFEPDTLTSQFHMNFGADADTAASYARVDIDPATAGDYHRAGVPATAAMQYSNNDFLPSSTNPSSDAGSWHRQFGEDAVTAARWADTEYTADEASSFIAAGHTDPKTAPPPPRKQLIDGYYSAIKGAKITELRKMATSLDRRVKPGEFGTPAEAQRAAIEQLIGERSRS